MLSESQRADFRDSGVILVESAYSAAQLEPLRQQHQQWIDESRPHCAGSPRRKKYRPPTCS
jgi:hypothetical protein